MRRRAGYSLDQLNKSHNNTVTSRLLMAVVVWCNEFSRLLLDGGETPFSKLG